MKVNLLIKNACYWNQLSSAASEGIGTEILIKDHSYKKEIRKIRNKRDKKGVWKRTALLIFSLKLEISGVDVQRIHKIAQKGFLSGDFSVKMT